MPQQIELEATPRTVTGKATKHLRKAGIIPANIFGHNEEPQMIQVNAYTFDRLLQHSAATSIITLKLPENATQTVLIRHVQHNAVTKSVLHIDFIRMGMNEHVKVKLQLHFVGEAPAVKLAGGVLLHLLESLEVECQASDLVDHLDVDISSLKEMDDVIHARDIPLPANYILLTEPEELVGKVAATRAEVAGEALTTAEVPPTASTAPSTDENAGA